MSNTPFLNCRHLFHGWLAGYAGVPWPQPTSDKDSKYRTTRAFALASAENGFTTENTENTEKGRI
jgi:hypothetical protein